jgi:hypothetical protein
VNRKSALSQFVMLILTLGVSNPCSAAWWELFRGGKPPLERRIAFGPAGLQLREDIRVTRYCVYELELRLVHREGRFGEFDALLAGREFPVSVIADVFRYDDDRPVNIGHFEGRPARSGRGMDLTTFELGHIDLDKGRYRVELRTVDEAPAFAGVSFDFVVQIPPKASCPRKEDK